MAAEDQNPQPDAAPAPGALVGPSLADFASQAIICAVLSEKLPGDPVVGEEGTGQLRLAEQASIRKAMVAFSGMTDTKFEILCAVVVIYLVRDGWVTVEKIRAGLPVKR